MFETFLLITLVILGSYSVLSDNLRRSIVFLGAFSLTMALTYLHYNAPDVALAEAAIGVGLSTIMYLVALKKISVYDICFVNEDVEVFDDDQIDDIADTVVRPLEVFLERTEEIEPQIAYTNHDVEKVIEEDNHDFIIHRKGNMTYLYGDSTDQIFLDIVANMDEVITDISDVRVIYRDEVGVNDTNT